MSAVSTLAPSIPNYRLTLEADRGFGQVEDWARSEQALWCKNTEGPQPGSNRTFGLRIPQAKWFFTRLARKSQSPSKLQELWLLKDRGGEHVERDRPRADILAGAILICRATQ